MDFDLRDPSIKLFNRMTGRAMLISQKKLLAEYRTSRGIERRRANWRRQAAFPDRLRDVPCLDCGGRFLPCAMGFDHRVPGEKSSRMMAMIGRASDTHVLAEVAKCDIVCGNSHRLRTYKRREARFERE